MSVDTGCGKCLGRMLGLVYFTVALIAFTFVTSCIIQKSNEDDTSSSKSSKSTTATSTKSDSDDEDDSDTADSDTQAVKAYQLTIYVPSDWSVQSQTYDTAVSIDGVIERNRKYTAADAQNSYASYVYVFYCTLTSSATSAEQVISVENDGSEYDELTLVDTFTVGEVEVYRYYYKTTANEYGEVVEGYMQYVFTGSDYYYIYTNTMEDDFDSCEEELLAILDSMEIINGKAPTNW